MSTTTTTDLHHPETSFAPPPPPAPSFGRFVFREKGKYLLVAIPALILQFIFFKLLYPFPDFISDSYSYIDTVLEHLDVNLWPIGYSRFIAALHASSPSDTFLVGVQYFSLQAALLLFFYTLLWFYRPARNTSNIIFVLLFFNPLFLYLSNCVLSDALFNTLSLLWWVQFIWMLHRPKFYQLFILAGLLGLAFTLRYTAMYYPVVAIVAFALSAHPLKWKILGSALGVLVMIPFILSTQQKTKEQTGTAEFSVFGGWQLANNAMYMYDHIEVDSTRLPPATRALDRMTRQYFKAIPPEYRELDPFPGTFFIKMPNAPLKVYMLMRYTFKDAEGQFKAWGMVSPIYKEYGSWLIRHYPFSFARYYLWLNTKNYFVPHLEKFGTYNIEMDSVWPSAQVWFQYKTPAVHSVSKTLQGTIFAIYPPAFMLINIYFIGAFLWLWCTKRLGRFDPLFRETLWLLAAFWVMNFAFSIFATPVVLRYQVLPLILLGSYSLLMLEFTGEPARQGAKGQSLAGVTG